MQLERVVSILDALAGGADPVTGATIPHDAFHTPDVIRALNLAANALRAPRKRAASAGARWSEEEDSLLCHEFDGGIPVAEIARQHGRTPGAINARLVKLGRLDPASVRIRSR